ncbi:MAG: hypothetical protein AABY27_05190 [Pseudomonadota bacterium]
MSRQTRPLYIGDWKYTLASVNQPIEATIISTERTDPSFGKYDHRIEIMVPSSQLVNKKISIDGGKKIIIEERSIS